MKLESPKVAMTYRAPMPVIHLKRYRETTYYLCPRCKVTLEREFTAYCDRCGQRLSWKKYKKAVIFD